jgi:hypothetical protein
MILWELLEMKINGKIFYRHARYSYDYFSANTNLL